MAQCFRRGRGAFLKGRKLKRSLLMYHILLVCMVFRENLMYMIHYHTYVMSLIAFNTSVTFSSICAETDDGGGEICGSTG